MQADELTLKPDTLKVWNEYEHNARVAMQQRLHGNGPFLRVYSDPGRLGRVRAGEIVVWEGEANSRRIPSGLIHDWMAAAFFPNAHIKDILAVSRCYAQFKNVYKPGIIEARLVAHEPMHDEYSVVFRNSSYFTKTALDAQFRSNYTKLDDRHWSSVTRTVSVREIENFGQPDQHELQPDRGHGYIWRIGSQTLFEERDGGVYVEEEAMALSRDIPTAMRWIAGPIIRHVARESAAMSIKKTRAAVDARPTVISSLVHFPNAE